MAYTSVYFVLAVVLPVHLTGGTPGIFLALLLCFMLFDGSPIAGMTSVWNEQALTEEYKRLYGCRTIKNCTATCLKSLNPADAIHKMKTKNMLSEPVQVGSL
ncbi:hypothetical protein CRYUN_Cryun17cG0091500 [Craigia yunnanensis]